MTEGSPNLSDLLKTALASGAVGFTLRTGHPPVIYPAKRIPKYDTQPSTSDDIEEILRQLLDSRQMRQLRTEGAAHFKTVFSGVPMLGGATIKGEDVRIELRKLTA